MSDGVAIHVVAMATNIFAFSLLVVLAGGCARIAGFRWPVLKGPANRMIILFCVFAAASFYVLKKFPEESCATASLEVWRPVSCGHPWIRPSPPQEVNGTRPVHDRLFLEIEV